MPVKKPENEADSAGLSRREFLKLSKNVALGIGIGGVISNLVWVNKTTAAILVSEGYLLVDTKKCQGCLTCMLTCSLVHEGTEDLSLSRIQVMQNSFLKWPDDLTIEQCRQCVDPGCVKACPAKALKVDTTHGNVRTVDEKKCIGCMSCIKACPYTPGRAVWDAREDHAQKCDLCAKAPFWNEKGGPAGKQACIEVCPVNAIKFTKEIPAQEDDSGYKVNLRDKAWKDLGYTTD